MNDTYWASNGSYQAFAEHLNTLIPIEGSVGNPRKNPALEKFRKASNVYYDLYNNGLYNRARQFKGAFGFVAGHYAYMVGIKYGRKRYSDELYRRVEHEMDKIILEAMLEQTAHANAKQEAA